MRYPPASSPAPGAAHFSPTQNQHQHQHQHPRRPQLGHHATTYGRTSPGDDLRVRGLADRPSRDPPTALRPSASRHFRAPHDAQRRARDAGRERSVVPDERPASIAKHRHAYPRPHSPRRRSHSPSRNSHCSIYPALSRRQPSRDRFRGPDHRPPDLFPRNRVPDPRDEFRDHEALPSPDFYVAPLDCTKAASIDSSYQEAPRNHSPLVYYTRSRNRSRSPRPVASNSRTRQPRRVFSPTRSDREPHSPRYSRPTLEGASSLQGYRSTRREPQYREGSGTSWSPPPPDSGRSFSESFNDNPNLVPLGQRPSSRLQASASSFGNSRRRSQRSWTPPSQQAGQSTALEYTSSRDRRTPDFCNEKSYPCPPALPSESLRDPRDLFPPQNLDTRGRLRRGARPPDATATGANSIEVNMAGRGNFRGNYGGQYPARGHFNQSSNDQRSFGPSTSGSSYQGSPPSQSPYPGSRGSWGGQQQGSPQK